MNCSWRNEYGSDPRSYEHYLSSSENEARKANEIKNNNYNNKWIKKLKFVFIFYRPYFYYYSSSVYNCEDRFLLISMRKYHAIIKVRVSKRFSAFKRWIVKVRNLHVNLCRRQLLTDMCKYLAILGDGVIISLAK